MEKIFKWVGILFVIFVATIVLLAVFFLNKLASSRSVIYDDVTLCNNLLKVTSRSFRSGLETRYAVDFTYTGNGENRKIIENGGFLPLPIGTKIPTVLIEAPDLESYSQNPPFSEPPLRNIFIDPTEFSASEFNLIGQCIRKEAIAINTIIHKNPGFNKATAVGGVAYIGAHDEYVLISKVNTDPNFILNGHVQYEVDDDGNIMRIGGQYAGDIFNGPVKSVPTEAVNERGETILQYANRLKNELK